MPKSKQRGAFTLAGIFLFVLLKGLGNTLISPIQLKELKSMIHDLC